MKLDNEKLNQYPGILNKEQFREVCHISKRTALYYLQSGLIRSRNTGKKTRCWQIRKDDVIQFAKDYELHPFRYRTPDNWYAYEEPNTKEEVDLRAIPVGEEYRISAQRYYRKLLENEHDILDVSDISRITGYGKNAIIRWIHKGELKIHYAYNNKFFIPKIFLYDLLTGTFYNSIVKKCPRHLQAIRDIYDTVFCGEVTPSEISEKGDKNR